MTWVWVVLFVLAVAIILNSLAIITLARIVRRPR